MVSFMIGNSESNDNICFSSRPISTISYTYDFPADSSSVLIPGLSDDIAMAIIARMSLPDISRSKAVCTSWLRLLSSQRFFHLRAEAGTRKECLCILRSNPSVSGGLVYHPHAAKWQPIPPMPAELNTYGLHNFSCARIGLELLVIGGIQFDAQGYPMDIPVPSSHVYAFNLVSSTWRQLSPMLQPRGSFACASIGGKIYVGGGWGQYAHMSSGGSRLASAEVYEPDSDTWKPVKSLSGVRAACVGFDVRNKFMVLGGHGASRVIQRLIPVDEYYNNAEILCIEKGEWEQSMPLWLEGERESIGPLCELHHELYMLSGNTILKFNHEQKWWDRETNLQRAHADASFFALDGEIYVVPGDKFLAARRTQRRQYCYNPLTKSWREMKLDKRLQNIRQGGRFSPQAGVGTVMCL